ncbi:PGPGW domain-containing protein [Herbiconiux sp. CPCC 203407]|uniref:PGPGW domain-containing protein n=1 Tax=Herbiconiux oxytropis TaxID=2970915 RepID=A0AA41XE34_9MICO|nr:PGPGW domain-containing protein [Herbiconiux oxytropis]MCS5722537.1 PGPGW domain-containing protein [Herbiconiux oxytropis]MCS5726477.1 PGPGW domain-containing protein [Herbiconiux oxytropis]
MTASQQPPVIVIPQESPAPNASDDESTAPRQPQSGVGDAAKNFGRALGRAAGRTAGKAAHGAREGIRKNPTANSAYRTGVGVVGGGTVALGVVLMPLPGPGALIALGGLGILSTEFDGAKKVRRSAEGAAKKAYGVAKEARARHRNRRDAAKNPAEGDRRN